MKKRILRKKVLLNEFHQKYNERTIRKISMQPPVTPEKAVEQYWKVKEQVKRGNKFNNYVSRFS